MNLQESDVLRALLEEPYSNQRILSEKSGHSLGVVNRCLKNLTRSGYLNDAHQLTEAAWQLFHASAPKNAIILAAGYGMRMVPINTSTSKGLLKVHGEPLVERLIRQLREANIQEIHIVVGFMKEQYEYLIDKYDIDLIVNSKYTKKNNLHSLSLAADRIANTYILPCDIWCRESLFRRTELYPWYMVSNATDGKSDVKVNRKMELIRVKRFDPGNEMIGIAYLTGHQAAIVRQRIRQLDMDARYDDAFWEEALYQNGRMILPARIADSSGIVEIDTYEQLRELDSGSNHLKTDVMAAIASALHVSATQIANISVLKKGMTNRSFLFSVNGEEYIMRVPGAGTDKIIDRQQEANVFKVISGLGLCDDPVYIDPQSGYKITKFLKGVRTCDAGNVDEVRKCMRLLSGFHKMRITVRHTFDIFGQIEFYESLWGGKPSMYIDYTRTKENVLSLKAYIEKTRTDWCLTHIDAVPDNFLFYDTPAGEALQLTDWEYAGMQDPHVDIAMFCIYSLYDKDQVDRLIDIYFEEAGEECTAAVRTKIYCYIAACGLLWSNWCEYKSLLGVEFEEYSLRQYRYAKDFFRYVQKEIRAADA